MDNEKKTNTITMKVSSRFYNDISKLAEKEKRSLSDLIRLVIEDYIQENNISETEQQQTN